ncbi:hypothetical protein M1D80_11890 [Phyllobacteriaceae bacterium JZ32]
MTKDSRRTLDDDAWDEFVLDVMTTGTAAFRVHMTDAVCRISIEHNFWKRDPEAKR